MTLTTFLSLLGLISLPTASARTVDDTLPLAADGAVEIENICGAVTVVAWDRPEIRVTGTLVEADDLLELKGTGQRVTVAVIDSHGEDVDCGDLKVQLPPGVRLEIETVSADVAAAGITGTLEIETVSGDVQAQGAPAELEIETVSGEVSVSVATFSLDIETVSGDVEIHDASGRLEAETVSGEVDISGGPFSQVEVTTVSGDLDLRAGLAPSAKVQLDTRLEKPDRAGFGVQFNERAADGFECLLNLLVAGYSSLPASEAPGLPERRGSQVERTVCFVGYSLGHLKQREQSRLNFDRLLGGGAVDVADFALGVKVAQLRFERVDQIERVERGFRTVVVLARVEDDLELAGHRLAADMDGVGGAAGHAGVGGLLGVGQDAADRVAERIARGAALEKIAT